MITTKVRMPTEAHKAFNQEILAVVKKYADQHNLTAQEVLALCSQIVGKCIALQDQTRMTMEIVWKVVGDNIEMGNTQAISELVNFDTFGMKDN